MRLVVDTNRFISALLRAGSTRRAFVETESELFAPVDVLDEIARHRASLVSRSGLAPADFETLLDALLAPIQWVPPHEFEPYLLVANVAMQNADPNDTTFLAAALAVDADAIWSEDKHFDVQTLVPRTRHPDRIER